MGLFTFRQFHRLPHSGTKQLFDNLSLHAPPQKIGPQEFAEGRGVLREPAGAAQFPSETAEWIIFEVIDGFWDLAEWPPAAFGIVGVNPTVMIENRPECVSVESA